MKTKLKKWKHVRTTVLFRNQYFFLQRDRVRLPNGEQYDYFINNQHGRAVTVLPFDDRGQLYLAKEFRYPVRQVIYNAVGGSVDRGETPQQAARRELIEETGIRAQRLELLGTFYANPARSGTVFYAYAAYGLTNGQAQPEHTEFIELERMSVRRVAQLIKGGGMRDPYFMSAFLLYLAKKKGGKVT